MTTAALDLSGAPALTLRNPWAAAVAHGPKRVENRSWTTKRRGWVLIHAGRTWDRAGWDRVRDLFGGWDVPPAVPSSVVAVAQLVDVCSAAVAGRSCRCGPWAMPDQHHWQLGQVATLPDPVPANGRQGLWWPAPDLLDAVASQLRDNTLRGNRP